jgi:hypothetical protein
MEGAHLCYRLITEKRRAKVKDPPQVYRVTAAVSAVMAPFAGTFLVSNGDELLVRCGKAFVPVAPRTV